LNPESDCDPQVTIIDRNIPSIVNADIVTKKFKLVNVATLAYG